MTFFLEQLPSGDAAKDLRLREDLAFHFRDKKANCLRPPTVEDMRGEIRTFLAQNGSWDIIYNDHVIYQVRPSQHSGMAPQPQDHNAAHRSSPPSS
ncbi:hypothetical protein A3G69_01170 [Candidatus Peribacteria bacterium RIFCSPLOWO2_12_FULL_53_10]|nr:MAG: hypothetical protein A3G69_01170 [Candidatus Peribacteria bacterium RIFCSPLOWO2_12_FULL_53_10]